MAVAKYNRIIIAMVFELYTNNYGNLMTRFDINKALERM